MTENRKSPTQVKTDACSICGRATLWACSDCQIDIHKTVHVCQASACRDAHEKICPSHAQRQRLELLVALDDACTLLDGWINTKCPERYRAEHRADVEKKRALIARVRNE